MKLSYSPLMFIPQRDSFHGVSISRRSCLSVMVSRLFLARPSRMAALPFSLDKATSKGSSRIATIKFEDIDRNRTEYVNAVDLRRCAPSLRRGLCSS